MATWRSVGTEVIGTIRFRPGPPAPRAHPGPVHWASPGCRARQPQRPPSSDLTMSLPVGAARSAEPLEEAPTRPHGLPRRPDAGDPGHWPLPAGARPPSIFTRAARGG